jgi:hypothetical protein
MSSNVQLGKFKIRQLVPANAHLRQLAKVIKLSMPTLVNVTVQSMTVPTVMPRLHSTLGTRQLARASSVHLKLT